jgi:hypothetical protein
MITDPDICTVVSLLPIKLNENKPLTPGNYTIPAVKNPDVDVETLIIRRGQFTVYIDETRPALHIPETANIIAESICRDFKVSSSHYQPSVAEPGLFWLQGGYSNSEVQTRKEVEPDLKKARALQNQWFKVLVSTADDDWSRHKMRRMISDLQRLACKCLNLERPWDIDLEVVSSVKMTNCKFCRAEVHPDAIICMHCRGILDMARYSVEFVSADK